MRSFFLSLLMSFFSVLVCAQDAITTSSSAWDYYDLTTVPSAPGPFNDSFSSIRFNGSIITCSPQVISWGKPSGSGIDQGTTCAGIENVHGFSFVAISPKDYTYELFNFAVSVATATPMKQQYPTFPVEPPTVDVEIAPVFKPGLPSTIQCTSNAGVFVPVFSNRPSPIMLKMTITNFSEHRTKIEVHCDSPVSYANITASGPTGTLGVQGSYVFTVVYVASAEVSQPNLAVGKPIISGGILELDSKQSFAPGKTITVNVPVQARDIATGDARSTELTLHYGNKVMTKSISLASLSSGAIQNVSIPVVATKEDVGDLKFIVKINSNRIISETDYSDNENVDADVAHILCDVRDANNGKTVEYFQQFDPRWSKEVYGNTGKTFSAKACYMSTLAMTFNYFGITKVQDGMEMNPKTLHDGLKATSFFPALGPDYQRFTGLNGASDIVAQNAVLYARGSYAVSCIKAGGEVESCEKDALSSVTYDGRSDSFGANEIKLVNQKICNGNPVIIRVPSPTTPTVTSAKHFALATAMSVGANGKIGYLANDPGVGNGLGKFFQVSDIRGYRLYRPVADPSMIFMSLAGGADMVVTDPQSRRMGYNPLTNESYNEIPGASYASKEYDADPTDSSDVGILVSSFEWLAPVNGDYKVQIFSKNSLSYQFTSHSYDEVGNIKSLKDQKGPLSLNGTALVTVRHSSVPLPIEYGDIKIERADFYDSKYKDMALISGVILPSSGRHIGAVEKYIQIKVGNFTQSIENKKFIKYKYKGHTIYLYGAFGKDGMLLQLDSDSGAFDLYIGNIQIDKADTLLNADILIQVDDLISKNNVSFKEIKRRK